MIVGLDFGTTNSGAATYDGKTVHLLPLDPVNANPAVCRTAIYITRGREFYLGSQAVNLYFQQNVGRPSRYRKVWVGEILQVFAELPSFYRDVYVFEDDFSPGRLFLSIKTVLRNPNYLGTVFQDQWFSASDLAAVFLIGMKQHIDHNLNQPAREVVLGRPVHFSTNPDEDQIAQSRLIDAAFKAGFEKVYFELEPVAAALSYERTLSKPETVLVFDFGGGTLDFTIMEIGNKAERKVLATGGIPVAGDVFDQKLFRVTIPKHLGEGDSFIQDNRRYPIPAHIFDLLTNPKEILSLNTPQNLEMLRTIHLGALHKKKTEALMKVVSSNYSLMLFDLVEKAKCQLSNHHTTNLHVETGDLTIEEKVTRKRFELAINQEYEAIREELISTVNRSGLQPRRIDRVIRTGGSSQIPLFNEMLSDIFGEQKLHAIDVFSSVTSGLGIRAHEIERGQIESKAWTPDQITHTETLTGKETEKREAAPVNLDVIRQRIEVSQNFNEGISNLPSLVSIFLTKHGLVNTVVEHSTSWINSHEETDIFSGFTAPIHHHILFITDSYKLISRELGSVFMAAQFGPKGIEELINLEKGETITALTHWDPHSPSGKYMALVTTMGQIRSFDSKLMAQHILPRPFFQLEKRYVGLPSGLLFADENELILGATNQGRLGKVAIKHTHVVTFEIFKTKQNERVICSAIIEPDADFLAVNPFGLAISCRSQDISFEGTPSSRGLILKKHFSITNLIPLSEARLQKIGVLTNLGREVKCSIPVGISPGKIPYQLVELRPGESLITTIP